METHQIVGFALIGAGVMDAALLPLLRAKLKDEAQRGIVTWAMIGGSVVMVGLGALFLTRVLSLA